MNFSIPNPWKFLFDHLIRKLHCILIQSNHRERILLSEQKVDLKNKHISLVLDQLRMNENVRFVVYFDFAVILGYLLFQSFSAAI